MKSIQYLPKKRYSIRSGGTKYYIDCSLYSRQPKSIKSEILLRNVENQNVAIIKAVVTDDTIKKKNKQIVVKIGATNGISLKEYLIGELLHQNKVPGFIRYICIFSCYDDTSKKAPKISQIESSKAYQKAICDATKTEENKKDILIMPYIKDGSIENYYWTKDNINLYKLLITHTFLSLAVAYNRIKFTHGYLHLGNVLFKRTKQENINYQLATDEEPIIVPTMGYKIVIMDFEKSRTQPMEIPENITITRWDSPHNVSEFWREIFFFFKNKVETPFKKYGDHIVEWINNDIINYIKKCINDTISNHTIIPLLDLIKKSKFVFTPIKKYEYNPDAF